MPNLIKRCTYLLLLPLLVLYSCSKDKEEEVMDLRQELAGTYNYVGGAFGSGQALKIEISKDLDQPDRINILFPSLNYSFYGQHVRQTEEGISFDIPKQLTYLSGLPFVTEGQAISTTGGEAQQAFFNRNSKELRMGLNATIVNSAFEELGNISGIVVAKRVE